MNDFVFLNPLKCQFCTICDIFLAFNMKNDNKISWNGLEFFLPNRYKVFSLIRQVWMITSLLFAFYIWLFWFWTPLKSRFWPCSFRLTLRKISPIENFHFFIFYQSTYSTLRKCKNWTYVFLINIYLLPGGVGVTKKGVAFNKKRT